MKSLGPFACSGAYFGVQFLPQPKHTLGPVKRSSLLYMVHGDVHASRGVRCVFSPGDLGSSTKSTLPPTGRERERDSQSNMCVLIHIPVSLACTA